ncbi:MAG TPA: hypothetical protein VNT79_10065 [Phycisphaerae bacterium]|nr:hypothetical protein [Phycisphaerae bacterium]
MYRTGGRGKSKIASEYGADAEGQIGAVEADKPEKKAQHHFRYLKEDVNGDAEEAHVQGVPARCAPKLDTWLSASESHLKMKQPSALAPPQYGQSILRLTAGRLIEPSRDQNPQPKMSPKARSKLGGSTPSKSKTPREKNSNTR